MTREYWALVVSLEPNNLMLQFCFESDQHWFSQHKFFQCGVVAVTVFKVLKCESPLFVLSN